MGTKGGDTKLRIAMLGHKRIPSREGGIEVAVGELAGRLAAMGHEVTCYNRKGSHVSGKEFNSRPEKEYRGVTLKPVLTLDYKGLAAVTASFSGAVAAAFGRYDIVHFHAEGPCAMMWIPKLFGKKCVCTVHGLDWKRAKWGKFGRAYIRFGEKCAAKLADEIIVLSKDTQKYFKDVYGRETVFIPNGVNVPESREAGSIKEKFGLEKGGYILFLGRLVPEKGIKYLLKAFRDVETDKKLVVAGGSSDTDSFVEEIRGMAKEDGRVLLTGFVEGQVLEELYSNAYVYVLPSDLEGMPLTLLEAMGYGNCCLVSDIGECTEVVEDKGVIFKKGDTEDLREKLQGLCDKEKAVEKYKKEASGFICGKYNWDKTAERTAALYKGKKDEKALRGNRRAENFGGSGHRHDAYQG